MGQRGGNASVKAVGGCLLHESERVRDAALSTLSVVAQKNRQTDIDEILILLDTVNEDRGGREPPPVSPKSTVLAAVWIVADKSNHYLIDSLTNRLGDFSFHAAHIAMTQIVCSNAYAVDALVAASVESGRKFCMFSSLSGPESFDFNEQVTLGIIKAALPYLQHANTCVQQRALILLGEMGTDMFQYIEDDPILTGVEPGSDDWSQQKRTFYDDVVASVVACVRRSGDELRRIAVQALRFIALRSDETLSTQTLSWLEEFDDAAVKEQALRLLGECSRKGNARAVEAASAYLTNSSEHIRTAALNALIQVVSYSPEGLRFPCRQCASQ